MPIQYAYVGDAELRMSIIAQLGVTDMRVPIQYAFSYPDRWSALLPPLDLAHASRLDFDRAATRTGPDPRCLGE